MKRHAIVGRTAPLRRLGDAMSAAAQGRRTAVVVSGEAGIGKTSLVRQAFDTAASDEYLVGWGTCWHGDGAPGFWPWTQALGDLVRVVGSEEALDLAGRDRETLAAIVRDFGPATDTTDDPDRHRLLLLDAAARWLEALAATRHVVIVLDDLQWADASTFDLLVHVTSASAAARLLVVGAYRHDEVDEYAHERLADLSAHATHIHLEGLTEEGVAELLRKTDAPPAAIARAGELHQRTGGHPLFVSELARLPALGAGGSLPMVVTGAVAHRLGTLGEPNRQLLDAASVLGNRLLPDVLGAVIEATPAEVLRLLEPAEAAGLVRTTSSDECWFTHDLFRETLYGRLDATSRAQLHGRIGDALAARTLRGGFVAPGDLADHFTRGARVGDPMKAIRWARRAASDDRRRSAFTEAAGHLRRARTAALDAGWDIDPEVLVNVLIEEADSQARSGEPHAARDLLMRAAAIAPDPTRQADVALAVQRLGAKFATPRDEIIGHLEAALEAVTGLDMAREARMTAALARELQHSVAQDRLRAGPLSERALALAREVDDDEALIAGLLAHHDAQWRPGTGAERAELGREIASVGARLRDVDRQAEGLLLAANGLLEAGSARFRPVLDRWFGLLVARDEPRDRYMVATRRACLSLLDGDADAAESLMHDAARLGERIHEPDTGNVLMSQRVALAQVHNDPAEFAVLAADAVRWWTGAPVLAHSVAAGALAAAGDLAAAEREIAMVADAGGWQSDGSYLRSVLITHLAQAATAVNDSNLCAALLTDIAPLTGSCGVNGALVAFAGPFAHTAGVLAAAVGDDARAAETLEGSIETARRLGATVWTEAGERALRSVATRAEVTGDLKGSAPDGDRAHLTRSGKIWTVSWRGEEGNLPHVKGLADIAILVQRPGVEVPALQLAGAMTAGGSSHSVIDIEALNAYRTRLDDLAGEIDRAERNADIGRVEMLETEREQLLAEIRRATGLGGRVRSSANDPAERARKAVSARIRDAIRRTEAVAPLLGQHLDRSIQTGLQCTYLPPSDDASIAWRVET